MTNSKQKGSRGERALRDVWKKHGYEDAHRSQQYSGKGESSADIEGIDPRLHIECKVGYTYKTIYDFMEQAVRDAKEWQIPIVNCKMDRKEWLCVMWLDDFIEIWKEKAEIVRCKDCMHRHEYECPMYHEEWFTIDEGDGYVDDDYNVIDKTYDDGFCQYGERGNDGKISNT